MNAIPSKVRTDLRMRDGVTCLLCLRIATDAHHRMRRRDGGHVLSNLVRLCRHHHDWAHANPVAARAIGIIIPALRKPELDPAEVPVKTLQHGWCLFDDVGGRGRISEVLAMELLGMFGMLGEAVA